MSKPLTPQTLFDGVTDFLAGVNTGALPSLLERNQLAWASNTTLRGGFATDRPKYRHLTLDFGGDAVLEARATANRFQGACYYKPDGGRLECLIASIGGRLFRYDIGTTTANVREITISFNAVGAVAFAAPSTNSTATIVVNSTVNIHAGYEVLIDGANYTVISVDSATVLTVENIDDTPGTLHAIGFIVQVWDVNPATRRQAWLWQAENYVIVNDGQSVPIFYNGAIARRSRIVGANPELPAGRMGIYWLGRNWIAGTDGRTYFASDIVGSSSGTPALQNRDAVLHMQTNTFLASGGRFIVPANAGDITALAGVAILDSSLGQGPIQVLTPDIIFSNNAPVDDTTWQSLTNPIQTVSQVTNGGLSQWSTLLANGDMLYRAKDGIRSLILGRRDFATWGNTPVSREMNYVLERDDQTLLGYSSAIVFDNRLLMTASPVFTQQGTYHRGLIALDFDVISSMRGKAPSVYDGLWTGLQTLQLLTGQFSARPRAFAFLLNGTAPTATVDLWELLATTDEAIVDDGAVPVLWELHTPELFKDVSRFPLDRKRLLDGEVTIGTVRGRLDIAVWWRSDEYPCWVPWHNWSVCALDKDCSVDGDTLCLTLNNFKSQYRQRMGFGEPAKTCDPITDKPYREGRTFQVRIMLQGHARLRDLKVAAVLVPEQSFAHVICTDRVCDEALPPPEVPDPTAEITNAWLHDGDEFWVLSQDSDEYWQQDT
jgi:hypothetical protein